MNYLTSFRNSNYFLGLFLDLGFLDFTPSLAAQYFLFGNWTQILMDFGTRLIFLLSTLPAFQLRSYFCTGILGGNRYSSCN
jgi:hypothetical protein